jgi:protein-tyrosine phosphatase
MTKILFVCLGNICRSPSAQAIFEDLLIPRNIADAVEVDSAGTASYHVGEPPCSIMQQAAHEIGIAMSHLRARQLVLADFDRFDYLYAMDRSNLRAMQRMAPPAHQHKLRLFLADAPELGPDVPDPYYGGLPQARHVLSIIEEGAMTVLQTLLEDEICP